MLNFQLNVLMKINEGYCVDCYSYKDLLNPSHQGMTKEEVLF